MVRIPPGRPRLYITGIGLVATLFVVMYHAAVGPSDNAAHLHYTDQHKRHMRSLATADQGAENHAPVDQRQRGALETDLRMRELGRAAPQGNVGVLSGGGGGGVGALGANSQIPVPPLPQPLDGKEAQLLIHGQKDSKIFPENAKVGVDKIQYMTQDLQGGNQWPRGYQQSKGDGQELRQGSDGQQQNAELPNQGSVGQQQSESQINKIQGSASTLLLNEAHRLVHLDLKGAPPQVTYLEQIFPLFKKWGATGLLIEYEDMFPYHGDIEDISAINSYRPEEIKTILQLAKDNGLVLIPLIQTFGHMEHVLKNAVFRHLREVDASPQIIIPLKDESLKVIQKMVDQIMELHPEISYLHIGCDEVYHLGESAAAKEMMKTRNLTKTELFISHVEAVAQYVKTKYPGVQPIMWDDMMRKTPTEVLKNSQLGRLVEPMIWVYTPKISTRVKPKVWYSYSHVFPKIWAASSFKGATGPNQVATNISYHLTNILSWIHTLNNVGGQFSKFQGIALTGWQRYDHFAILCELLPVGLPSLAMSLQTLIQGTFNKKVYKTASTLLGCTGVEIYLSDSPAETYCKFPGAQIFMSAQQLHHIRSVVFKSVLRNPEVISRTHEYLVQHKFINPDKVAYLFHKYKPLMNGLDYLEKSFYTELSLLYQMDTVQEFVEVHVSSLKKILEQRYTSVNSVANQRVWPRRPLS